MSAGAPSCRFCGEPLQRTLVDLGEMPLANAYLDAADLACTEPVYPLHARVCDGCMLVQLDVAVPPDRIFGEYAYFSSYSDTWVDHARGFAERATASLALNGSHLVVELGSNDGYLLRHFLGLGVGVLGVEPAANVAAVAVAAGVPTEVQFFGSAVAAKLADAGLRADLLVANNVLAHVPDLNDVVAGMALLLAPGGVVSVEVPHLLRLIEGVQFDTIYHEHYSYFSLHTLEQVFRHHGLAVFDVNQLSTHGGSLRVWGAATGSGRPDGPGLGLVRAAEAAAGITAPATYEGFAARVDACRDRVAAFLDECARARRQVVAYGAAAKGNTLLNACGITPALVPYVVDRNPHKQGRFLPGSHLPVHGPEQVEITKPDLVLILPWNLRDEIAGQMAGIRAWGGRFVTPVPTVEVFS